MELYERILSRVGRDERQRSSNSVLENEISALHRAVTKVAATFAKVEEVRDAMKHLQQGNVLTGRSESLMREMDNAMKLQRKLKKAMKMALQSGLRYFVDKAAPYAENMKNSQAVLRSIAKITNALNNRSKQQTPK